MWYALRYQVFVCNISNSVITQILDSLKGTISAIYRDNEKLKQFTWMPGNNIEEYQSYNYSYNIS